MAKRWLNESSSFASLSHSRSDFSLITKNFVISGYYLQYASHHSRKKQFLMITVYYQKTNFDY